MTRTQIAKALKNANISTDGVEIRKDEIEICVNTKSGEFSQRLTEAKMNKIAKALGWGGYRCGYGGWVLQATTIDMGEYNDKSSRWHY